MSPASHNTPLRKADRLGGGILDNRQNAHAGNPTPPSFPGSGAQSWKGTYSHYNFFNQNSAPHGPLDLNFGFQDGSVRRVSGVGRPPVFTPSNVGSYPLHAFPFWNEVGSGLTGPPFWLLEGE